MLDYFNPLRLLAKDIEDLQIFAAHLQDALTPLMAMMFEKKTQTFTILANRFCWEIPPLHLDGRPVYHRVHSGVCFQSVQKVQHRGFQRDGKKRILNLLTVHVPKPNNIHLIFSGDHEIQIQTNDIHCNIGDLHHPWPTRHRPIHSPDHDHLAIF